MLSIKLEARPAPIEIDVQRTAVIVVDMQNDFGSDGGMFDRAGINIEPIKAIVPAIAAVLHDARSAGVPVIYVKMGHLPDLSDAGGPSAPHFIKHHPLKLGESLLAPDGSNGRFLIRDTWNTEIVPALAPAAGDIVVWKHRYSGFFETELDSILKALGIRTLIVTGATTSICVDSTVRDATFRDYACIVLADCTAEPIAFDAARSNHEASLLSFELLFGWVAQSAAVRAALARRTEAAE
jgi:ureidoacrylate peracid hydrolase